MRAFAAIAKREFFAYFLSPLAYVVLTVFTFVSGGLFWIVVRALNQAETPRTEMWSLYFTNVFFWILTMALASVISMRLISEERKSGSIETLLTAPVGEGTVVVAKFVAGLSFFLFLWVPTVVYWFLIPGSGNMDMGPFFSTYLGVLLVGMLFMSAGTFASSLTKNQIVAAVVAFCLVVAFFLVGVVEGMAPTGLVRDVLSHMNLLRHMDDFVRGIVDTRRVVYYLSTTVFFLFLGTKVLELSKGR